MYAIIETGGKQYSVTPGDQIRVEKLEGEVGDAVTFDRVKAVGDDDGRLRTGNEATAVVSATISAQGRARKIEVFKFKRRKMYRRRMGHRQAFTQIRIESILEPGTESAEETLVEAAAD